MKGNNSVSKLLVTMITTLVLTAGCTNIKVNGGGTMASTSGVHGDKAVITFHAEKCTADEAVSGRINYHDMYTPGWANGGVKFTGSVVAAAQCGQPGSELICTAIYGYPRVPFYFAEIGYKSTNPKYPGSGIAVVIVADNGQGVQAISSDIAVVQVTTGPYAGYMNTNTIQGNMNSKSCE
jgi:hypothetical protein